MESLESNNSTSTDPAAMGMFQSGPMDPWPGMVSGMLNAKVHGLEKLS